LNIDDIKTIVSVLSLAWAVFSFFAPYLNEFLKGVSVGAALMIFVALAVSRLEGAKKYKSFPCSTCREEISVRAPKDRDYTQLNLVRCEQGDSIKFTRKCPHCKTKNVRYWDREHFYARVG